MIPAPDSNNGDFMPAASRRAMPWGLCAVAAAVATALAGCASSALQNDLGTNEVQIQRTAYGIPHVTANNYESLAYGVAYAHAQDNVCATAEQVVTVNAQRAKYFGAATPGALGLRTLPNVQIDLFISAHMDDAALARANTTLSADSQASMRGYIAGYNRYLADTGIDKLPAPCRGAAWVRPLTAADLYRMGELSMTQAGVTAFADAVLGAAPPAATTSQRDERTAPSRDEAFAALAPYRITDLPEGGGFGSNGWAFGRDATPDGGGLLLGNPHFPWVGANRFWQLHITIPGKVDAMGAAIGPSSVVQIGFNKDVAWTHTVSTGKRFTVHELTLVPGDPTSYVLDGQPRKMTSKTVEVEFTGPDGKAAKRQHTVWSSVWGPLLVVPRAGLTWNAKTAYAIKDANTLNTRAPDTWLQMDRATSVAELRAAMGNQGIPWVNTIAADRAGNALYADLSVVPDVSAEMLQRCAPSKPAAALFGAGIAVLDGSKSNCDWIKDPSAASPGLIPAARMPAIVRSDWVQNSNDSYWLSNPAHSFAGISPMVGPQATPQRLRTRIGIEEIRNRLAGTDGLPGNKMGMNELQQVLFRDRNLAGALVMPDLAAACGAGGAASPAQTEGCQALAAWKRTSDLNDAGAPLFREFWRKAKDIPNVWRVPFNPADPVATPAGLNLADPAVKTAVFGALGDAVDLLRRSGFAPNATLAQAQVKQTNRGPVPLHGGDEFEGVLNKLETQGAPTIGAKGYDVNYGSSYIQTVSWDARGPLAQAILTYGQSSDPASPFAYDQLALFSRKQWNVLPFHPADVAAQQVGPTLRLKR